MHDTDDAPRAAGARRPRLLADARDFGRALRERFGAQLGLLRAEWALARSALAWLLVAGLIATVVGVTLTLTALALLALALATWWGSWLWALLALALVQLVVLGVAIVLFRRCMHWLSLPLTREEGARLLRPPPAAPADAASAPHPGEST